MTLKPKWLTSNRKTHLVSLFVRSNGFCVYGEHNCQFPEHHYEVFIESLIDDWQADDRQQAKYDWQAERKLMHSLNEKRLPLRGRFNNISSEIWHSQLRSDVKKGHQTFHAASNPV